MANKYKYSVGTSETGSYCYYYAKAEAKKEAKAWAAEPENTADVCVWVLDRDGNALDAIVVYSPKPQVRS